MEGISVLIPVFRESNLLESLLNKLLRDPYKNKEIITVIDEPTKNSLGTVKRYKKQVKFVINKKRVGKARALNEAEKIAKGDILLFIDSDCIISKNSNNFLRTIKEKMKNADLLDIKKNVIEGDSFFSKMFKYESLTGALISYIFNKFNVCLGVCGQAFSVKRDFFEEIGGFKNVVAEDLEIGMQSYLKNKKYRYINDVELYAKTPYSWSSFLKQRKRWGIGAGLHFKRYWKPVLRECIRRPTKFLISLYYFWPTVFSLISLFFIDSILGKFLLLTLISLSLKFTFLMPIMFLISLGTLFFKNILLFLLTYILSSVAFFIASKKLGYKFKNKEFAIYYTIYSPVSFFIYNYYFLKALFSSNKIVLGDWKFD
jgi:cellulose synthase/poly-beta-1,6-N-acetylglucosamine synthase-like glycosyltransferase